MTFTSEVLLSEMFTHPPTIFSEMFIRKILLLEGFTSRPKGAGEIYWALGETNKNDIIKGLALDLHP